MSIDTKKNIHIYRCRTCGRQFAVRDCQSYRLDSSKQRYNYCRHCQKEYRNKKAEKLREKESQEWEIKKAQDRKLFEQLLSDWNVKDLNDISTSEDATLFIIGNGFDLMHGVPSSYLDFDRSIGKNQPLRFYLENYLDIDDIWADFENALGHINIGMMMNTDIIDMWLDNYDAYNPDAQAADFFAAVDMATEPAMFIQRELPKRFRKWVESLECDTEERPLKNIMKSGKVLCFNYTEFIEDLYSITSDKVCYIHGCRKTRPREKLILGHIPGAEDEEWNKVKIKTPRYKDPKKRYLFEAATETAARNLLWYEDAMTKDCSTIIENHKVFFDDLRPITDVIVIGHSMSRVDWDYFDKIASSVENINNVRWHIGCHGLNDFTNMTELVAHLGIKQDNISLFRTDTVPAVARKTNIKEKAYKSVSTKKDLAESHDKMWKATLEDSILVITNHNNCYNYELELSGDVSSAFFDDYGKRLFVLIRGAFPGVILFSEKDGLWSIVDELEGIPNQGLLNKRLSRVFLRENSITFVYRSRVRRYDLNDGHMYCNEAVRNAPEKDYSKEGKDVTSLFMRDRKH